MQKLQENNGLQPAVFFISQKSHLAEEQEFAIINRQQAPQQHELNSLARLKMPLTGVQDHWRKIIRPYLNDSEFVEIDRKNNVLNEDFPYYGQTVVDYSCGSISKVFSRAYFKLYEMLRLGILDAYKDTPIRVACLAEGPGGFLNCLTDYRSSNGDNYYAITLKGRKENVSNDWGYERTMQYMKSIKHRGVKMCLSYGETGTGDITDPRNIRYFRTVNLNGEKCEMVTADGGMDCCNDDEYTYQQLVNCKLFFAEVVTALSVQKQGGCFVLKMYDWQFMLTHEILVLLSRHYSKVCVVKPVTSRPANSERYVICEGFIGCQEGTIERLIGLLQSWNEIEKHQLYFMNQRFVHGFIRLDEGADIQVLKNIAIANRCLVEKQMAKLKEGLELSGKLSDKQLLYRLLAERKQAQIAFARRWCDANFINHV